MFYFKQPLEIMTTLRGFLFLLLSIELNYCFEDKTVYQYLQDNGFTLLSKLISQTRLDNALSGNGPYTILAPTDSAISLLDPNLLSAINANDFLLETILNYHILDGFQLIPEFQTGKDEVTINGQAIAVTRINNTVVLNNVSRITSNNDVILRNGIVHPIDTVLVPPVFSTNNLAEEFIVRDGMFQEFTFGLLLTNLTNLIEKGEYTVFAPTDAAFIQGFAALFYRDMPNAAYFYLEMLRYHIVPGARTSSQLKDGDVLYTIHGSPIHINRTSSGVYADGAKVVKANIGASNGVIHAIDKLIFPDDLRQELENLQQQMTPSSN